MITIHLIYNTHKKDFHNSDIVVELVMEFENVAELSYHQDTIEHNLHELMK